MYSNLFIFIHIPKAAGSTLQSIINRQFLPRDIFNINGETFQTVQESVNHLRNLSEKDRNRIKCVKGHIPYGIHRWFTQNPVYVTMLRDPVSRMISDYFYAWNLPHHSLHENIHQENLSLFQFTEWRNETGLCNSSTRCLSENIDWDNLSEHAVTLPDSALDQAKEKIDNCFDFAGITEMFDESIIFMENLFGWESIFYHKMNVTPGFKPGIAQIDRQAIEKIKEYNHLDIKLYHYVKDRLKKNIQKGGKQFNDQLEKFISENKKYQRKIKIQHYSNMFRHPAAIKSAVKNKLHNIFQKFN